MPTPHTKCNYPRDISKVATTLIDWGKYCVFQMNIFIRYSWVFASLLCYVTSYTTYANEEFDHAAADPNRPYFAIRELILEIHGDQKNFHSLHRLPNTFYRLMDPHMSVHLWWFFRNKMCQTTGRLLIFLLRCQHRLLPSCCRWVEARGSSTISTFSSFSVILSSYILRICPWSLKSSSLTSPISENT